MRLFAFFLSLSLLLTASTCTSSDPRRGIPQLQLLERTWLHAHEEDQNDVRVYRPNTYPFPPSRGRTGFSFEHNGLFMQYDIAPTDGLAGRGGQWKALSPARLSITLDDQQQPPYELEILELQPELLKVRLHQ